jgi:hypothetical protein
MADEADCVVTSTGVFLAFQACAVKKNTQTARLSFLCRQESITVMDTSRSLFLTERGVVLNRIKLYKFGLPVGELMITFSKDPA